MTYTIKNYDPKFIEKQVDLIWEITDNWKYPYATSYDSIKQTYAGEGFDPTTRFYAVDEDQLVGYVTSAVVKDVEKGDHATIRFPLAKNNDEEIISSLLEKVEERLLQLGITKIRASAGVGMGNTIDLAEKFGFTQVSTIFKRSKVHVEDLVVSGNSDQVIEFQENDSDAIKDLFMTKMGMPEKQGEGFYKWAYGNKLRKEANNKNLVSWKLTRSNEQVSGFSYLHRSDHNSELSQLAPIWVKEGADAPVIFDGILSSHITSLKPHGMKTIQTYLTPQLLHLENIYGKFGFKFDATYSYEKIIS